MDPIINELVSKAKSLLTTSGESHGKRYPQELKDIVASLVNDHGLSSKRITKLIPISSTSARVWPKQSRSSSFKNISLRTNEKEIYILKHQSGIVIEVNSLDLVVKILKRLT